VCAAAAARGLGPWEGSKAAAAGGGGAAHLLLLVGQQILHALLLLVLVLVVVLHIRDVVDEARGLARPAALAAALVVVLRAATCFLEVCCVWGRRGRASGERPRRRARQRVARGRAEEGRGAC